VEFSIERKRHISSEFHPFLHRGTVFGAVFAAAILLRR
jgi:hypothetical protein